MQPLSLTKQVGPLAWFNGALIPWQSVNVSILAHGLHYGSTVFEGIRIYQTPQGPVGMRLSAHLQRLLNSAKIYHWPCAYNQEQLLAACQHVYQHSGFQAAYLRPLLFRDMGTMGLKKATEPLSAAVVALDFQDYLGAGAQERGVRVGISSWRRPALGTLPLQAKAAGNYLSSQLMSEEAIRHGYDEAIALDVHGAVSEGPGENVFVVKDGVIYTPAVCNSILPGLTRDCVKQLAAMLDLPLVETQLPREALLLADELFFAGTAVEIVPVVAVDGQQVGDGKRGPLTYRLQQAYLGLFRGETEDKWGWLEPMLPL